jgi:hypothetical protein
MLGQFLKRRAGVGDGNKVLAAIFLADRPKLLPEVIEEREHLGGRRLIARDEEQGLS